MFNTGDRVVVNPLHDPRGRFRDVVYEVERLKQVNALLRPVLGPHDGRKLNCRPEYLLPAPSETPGTTEATSTTTAVGVPFQPYLWAGQVVVVTSTNPRWHYEASQRFVVLGQTTPERVKIARLGGENGATWTLPRRDVTVVDL